MSASLVNRSRKVRWPVLLAAICIGVPLLMTMQGCCHLCRSCFPERATEHAFGLCFVPCPSDCDPNYTGMPATLYDQCVGFVPSRILHVWRGDRITFTNNTRYEVAITTDPRTDALQLVPPSGGTSTGGAEAPLIIEPGKTLAAKVIATEGVDFFLQKVEPGDRWVPACGLPTPGIDIDGQN